MWAAHRVRHGARNTLHPRHRHTRHRQAGTPRTVASAISNTKLRSDVPTIRRSRNPQDSRLLSVTACTSASMSVGAARRASPCASPNGLAARYIVFSGSACLTRVPYHPLTHSVAWSAMEISQVLRAQPRGRPHSPPRDCGELEQLNPLGIHIDSPSAFARNQLGHDCAARNVALQELRSNRHRQLLVRANTEATGVGLSMG